MLYSNITLVAESRSSSKVLKLPARISPKLLLRKPTHDGLWATLLPLTSIGTENLHLKYRGQVISEILRSFETEARCFPLFGIDLVRRFDTLCVGVAVIDITHVGDTITDVALREGGA